MKPYLLLITLMIAFQGIAQQSEDTSSETINEQFNALYKNSGSYQVYKVIYKDKYRQLQKSVSDSISGLHKELATKSTRINTQKRAIAALEGTVKETTTQLKEAVSKENSVALFGTQLTKQWYAFILFSIIAILAILLGYFVFMFKNNNVLTKKAELNVEDVENELAIFRKKSIKREQKLRRELLNEIAKNKNTP